METVSRGCGTGVGHKERIGASGPQLLRLVAGGGHAVCLRSSLLEVLRNFSDRSGQADQYAHPVVG